MKTLIINGSPRKKGDTVTLIDELKKHLKGKVYDISAYYDDISPCTDCRHCWKKEGCKIDDKMQKVYKLLDEVDNVILASPLYFSELTGQLLNVASRLQVVYAAKFFRGLPDFHYKKKTGALILTGGGDAGPTQAIQSAHTIFKLMNVEQVGTVYSLNTNHIATKNDPKALAEVRELALKLNALYKEN